MSQIYTPAIRRSWVISHSPVFYGWVIMLMGTLGMVMTSPGQTYAVSVFIEYFINDLGISRSLVSTLYTIGTLVGSFALPIVGRQLDRRGPRLMMSVVAVLFGAALSVAFCSAGLLVSTSYGLSNSSPARSASSGVAAKCRGRSPRAIVPATGVCNVRPFAKLGFAA